MKVRNAARSIVTTVAVLALIGAPGLAFASDDAPLDVAASTAPEVPGAEGGADAAGAASEAEPAAGPLQEPATAPVPEPATDSAPSSAGAADSSTAKQSSPVQAPAPTPIVKESAAKESAAKDAPAAAAILGDPPPEKKVYVCKYSGTPGVDERLQTLNEVSVATLGDDFNDTFPWPFVDAHQKSIAIGFIGGGNPVLTSRDCPKPQGPPVLIDVLPNLRVASADCVDLYGRYSLEGVDHVTFEDGYWNSLSASGILHTEAIEVYAVADPGYVFANGSTRIHIGTIPARNTPECPADVATPTIETGACLPDGNVTPATVTTTAGAGVEKYVVDGKDVVPGESIEVRYGAEIPWHVVLTDGWSLGMGVIGEGTLSPIAKPLCEPVGELKGIAPTIHAGACLPDGTAAPATVSLPDVEGVESYLVDGVPFTPGDVVDVSYDAEISWSVVLEPGYRVADGEAREGALGPIDEPLCELTLLTEVAPTIQPGACLSDGTAAPATVVVPDVEGALVYLVDETVALPGETIEVPYDTDIFWVVVLEPGYDVAEGVDGMGWLDPIDEPVCGLVDDPTDPIDDPTVQVNDPITTPTVVVTTTTSRSLATTGSDTLAVVLAAGVLIAAGAVALVARHRRT